jgi:hypothetical protein
LGKDPLLVHVLLPVLQIHCLMTSPAPKSFPSFSSFPEFDSGPSNQRSPPRSQDDKRRKEGAKGDKDKRRRDKHRSDKSRRQVDNTDESRGTVQDDERLKAEEHRQRKGTPAVFYTDRKGDRLNIRYGGLYAGDVPKYRLVGGKFCIWFHICN